MFYPETLFLQPNPDRFTAGLICVPKCEYENGFIENLPSNVC
jgi:hypothetical protein